MGRRAKPKKSEAEAKRPLGSKSPKDNGARVRDLEKGLAEAREQQAATAEILRVISSSPADVEPVFDTIVKSAVRLCGGLFSALCQFDGELIHASASHNYTPEALDVVRRVYPVRPSRAMLMGRAILERTVAHVPDVELDPEYQHRDVSAATGFRSGLAVPMLRDGTPIGAILVARAEPGPFSESQIELLKTFADQAVIAIENVRLFNETRESLEQQTATAQILRVISSSPTDVRPVFDTIVKSAARLCDALFSTLGTFDGGVLQLVATHHWTPEAVEMLHGLFPARPSRASVTGRTILERAVVHVPDVELDPEYGHELSRAVGFRSALGVPMLRDGVPLGVIGVGRAEPGPFTENQIALLNTFADQAVIAIENVRLFTELAARNAELSESLEQQTATAAILRVISSSPTDLQPVLDALVKNAGRLCQSAETALLLVEGDQLRLAAHHGYVEGPVIGFSNPIHRGWVAGRAVVDARTVHVEDLANAEGEFPVGREIALRFGHRTALAMPLLREGAPIGALFLRRRQLQKFSDKEIALLQTFADQAVIAIENVRLFTELQSSNRELRAALDQQTATAEILRVISGSPTAVEPVFQAIVQSGLRLLGGYSAILLLVRDDQFHLAAFTSTGPQGDTSVARLFPVLVAAEPLLERTVRERRPVVVEDVETEPGFTDAMRQMIRARGWRSSLQMPMVRDSDVVGLVAVTRRKPGRFAADEMALLETFAAQAVIAIENAHLFTELQTSNRELTTALDTQTATSDILRVISRSQTDVQPVFEAIVASAVRLLQAHSGALSRIAGDQIEIAALTSTDPAGDAILRARFPQSLHSEGPHAQVIRARVPLNTADVQSDPRMPEATRAMARARGYRSVAVVPLLRHDEAVGAIAVTRREPGGFTDDEIALLQTFADQAVIAIENVRLFNELEERNRALTEALEQQTATSEVLKVMSSSAFDLHPVLETLIENAVRLCGADKGFIYRQDGEVYRVAVSYGHSSQFVAVVEGIPIRQDRESATGTAVLDRRVVHIHDILADPEYRWAEQHRGAEEMHRTILAVPMLREGAVIGVIVIRRTRVDPFTDKQIELMTTFADQAVIAIENVRLFKELEARTHALTRSVGELRALGEIGQAISSTLDLPTVLSTIVARATQLSGTDAGVIYEYDERREVFVPRATEHLEAEIVATMFATPVRKGEGATGRLAEVQEPVQVPDILEAPAESRVRGALVHAGYRALLAVPLVRDDRLLGGLTVIRKATGAFAPEVIELLRTFATQSALAILNARLFLEIEDKSRQLEVASQHKSEFLANMSHELRTPLNAIIGFSEVLYERMFGGLNEKQDEYLKDIYASGQHLLSLINDILDLSKIEAGRMELELTDFDLPTALENALTLVRERAGRRGIALGQTVGERLGQIRGDERKVKQVLLNLLSNALKFTPEGGRVEVSASLVDAMAEISVTDTGVGIAPEDQEAIFEEFRQVGTAAKKVEGTGLGLALSQKFVELHGGRIWVRSQVGEGSTFTFTLPARFEKEMGA